MIKTIKFKIDKKNFTLQNNFKNNFIVKSNLKDYKILWKNESIKKTINPLFKDSKNLFLIDKKVYNLYFKNLSKKNIFLMDAKESLKNVNQAIKFTDFLIDKKATKQTKIIIIGGGIIQDVGAFACAMFKRGLPWVLVPTTLLSITDSCIGAKTGLNYGSTKNIHALFSAPTEVIINLEFLSTLKKEDIISGIGESLKLCIIGGQNSLSVFNDNIKNSLENNLSSSLKKIIIRSLYIKKAIIEYDEFEFNHRRSLNYGHSIGHAIEIMSNYKIPHGISIIFGILIENQISVNKFGMKNKDAKYILDLVNKIKIPKKYIEELNLIDFNGIDQILTRDKKTIGKILKIAIPTKKIGLLQFCNQPIDKKLKLTLKKITKTLIEKII